jgi:hypothetical protein
MWAASRTYCRTSVAFTLPWFTSASATCKLPPHHPLSMIYSFTSENET